MLPRFSRGFFKSIEKITNNCWTMSASTSVIPTMGEKLLAHQTSLPRLPVPPLHPSLEKYLLSVRPLLTEEEYHHTVKVVKDFGAPDGLGVKLHSMLKERAKNKDNWLDEWWLRTAYLEFRMPVVMYSSPGLIFPLKEFQGMEKQLRYAARLVAGALDFRNLLDKHQLSFDYMGDKPLDMSQYYKIYSACRLPRYPKDELLFFDNELEKARHITVAHNNHYFSVDVYGDDGAPLNESQILSQLKNVVEQSQYPKLPIGALTTLHRDAWAGAYKRLCKYDSMNKASVQSIQKSIFMLCLDKAIPEAGTLNRQTHVGLQTIHGGGSHQNAGNRWYDKPVQFIVGEDGVVGLTYEHSPAEGPPIVRMMIHILEYIDKTKGNKWLPSVNTSLPKKLRFNLSDETLRDIEEAERDLEILINDLELSSFTFETYGKDFIKSMKLSPDSFIQMAIQLAYFKIHKQIAATYESGSTRMFLKGRTDTIRSASMEALDFCKMMTDNSCPAYTQAAALRSAVDAHKEYTTQVINGLGVDRLLLGLKMIALECGLNIPELFLDTGFTTSTHFKLSTSQVPSSLDSCMCYGPLVPDGYGCCYNPRTSTINFSVSACNSSPETHSNEFMKALIESLTEMQSVIIRSQKAKL